MTTFSDIGLTKIGLAGTSLFAAALFVAGAAHAESARIHRGGPDAASLPVQNLPDAAATSIFLFPDDAGYTAPDRGDDN